MTFSPTAASGRVDRSPREIRYALLGAGRAAAHFAHYLDHLGIPYRRWNRVKSDESQSLLTLQEILSGATHAVLLVSDSAIESSALQARKLQEESFPQQRTTWIHFSGSLTTSLAWGCHPLMSFTQDRLYDPETYRSMSFIVDRDAPAFGELLPGLLNPHFRLDPAKKALYHALCVLSGNFTALLWGKFFDDLENRLLIPKKAALPYLQTVSENLRRNPSAALTGPLVRGDQETLERNHSALNGDPYQAVYDAFVRAYQEKTHERH